jgi:hypothetical protein
MAAVLESFINLDSYTLSPGFFGFLECVEDCCEDDVKSIVSRLCDWVYSDQSKFSLSTSLHFPSNRAVLRKYCEVSDSDFDELLFFEKEGLVFAVDGEKFFKELGAGEIDISEIWWRSFSHFDVLDFSRRTIERILIYQLSRGGMYGHFFIGSVGAGVIFCPSDDVGFDFFVLPGGDEGPRLERLIDIIESAGAFRFVDADNTPALK